MFSSGLSLTELNHTRNLDMLEQPLIYIVLVNYKSWQDTAECLESLLKLSYSNFKVVVVDNDSRDRSIDFLEKWALGEYSLPFNKQFYASAPVEPGPVTKPIAYTRLAADETENITNNSVLYLIESQHNLGFAGGNNIGLRIALSHKASYVWLLNNDTVVAKDTLSCLVDHFEATKQTKFPLGILGAKLLYYHNPSMIQAVLGRYKPLYAGTTHVGLHMESYTAFNDLTPGEDDYVVGASMLVSDKFVRDVGYMSEEYFLYFEEIDWVKRGNKKGYRIDVCLAAEVYHKEGASIGGGMKDNSNKSELSDFYSIRNRLIITKKFYKKYLLSVYLSLIFVVANRIIRKQYSRIPLIIKAIKSSRISST